MHTTRVIFWSSKEPNEEMAVSARQIGGMSGISAGLPLSKENTREKRPRAEMVETEA